jgi:hypothetical protein
MLRSDGPIGPTPVRERVKGMTHQNKKRNFTSYLTQFRMHDYMLDCTAINIANSTGTS